MRQQRGSFVVCNVSSLFHHRMHSGGRDDILFVSQFLFLSLFITIFPLFPYHFAHLFDLSDLVLSHHFYCTASATDNTEYVISLFTHCDICHNHSAIRRPYSVSSLSFCGPSPILFVALHILRLAHFMPVKPVTFSPRYRKLAAVCYWQFGVRLITL